jgi:hypothetical protein
MPRRRSADGCTRERVVSDVRDRWAAAVLSDKRVTDAVARTAWKLREYANTKGKTFVGLTRIATEIGRSRRTVMRHLKDLENVGHIKRVPGAGQEGRGGKTTLTVFVDPGSTGDNLGTTSKQEAVTPSPGGSDKRTSEVVTPERHPNHSNQMEPGAGAPAARGARAAQTKADARELFTLRNSALVYGVDRKLIQTATLEQLRKHVDDAHGQQLHEKARNHEKKRATGS